MELHTSNPSDEEVAKEEDIAYSVPKISTISQEAIYYPPSTSGSSAASTFD
jgi:hypothetical protein